MTIPNGTQLFPVNASLVSQVGTPLGEFIGIDFTSDFTLAPAGNVLRVAVNPAGSFATGIIAAAVAAATTSPTISNPTITGGSTFQGTKGKILSEWGESQTAAGGAGAAILSYPVKDNTSIQVDFIGSMKGAALNDVAGAFKGSVCVKRTNGGAAGVVGAAVYQSPQVTVAGDDMTFSLVGNTLNVFPTAADATTKNWSVELRIQELTNA